MTRDEIWMAHYEEVMAFMKTNQRRPSKYKAEELRMHNWLKATKKVINKGKCPPNRLKKFTVLMEVAKKYRRLNQFRYLVAKD